MSSTNSGDEINESWQSFTDWSFDTPLPEDESSYGDIVFDFDVVRPGRTRKMVGKYLVGGLLGRGSYSKVKEMLDTTTLSRRAAKILKSRVLRRIPFGEQTAHREIALLRSLTHQNVVQLVDVLWRPHKEKVYVVLEYCPIVLQELLDAAPAHKLPAQQAHDYFCQLLEGVAYLHSRGVVHKDIKPGNLLLSLEGVLKLCDFGVAEVLPLFRISDACSSSQGSPAFQPPEVADCAGHFSGFKLDVWSCGVTLYCCVVGRHPFRGDSVFAVMTSIVRCEPCVPEELDAPLQELLLAMLAREPERRWGLDRVRSHVWVMTQPPFSEPPVLLPCPSAVSLL